MKYISFLFLSLITLIGCCKIIFFHALGVKLCFYGVGFTKKTMVIRKFQISEKLFLLTVILMITGHFYSQGNYAPSADSTSSTAMYKDSSAFVAWAIGCDVERGYQNILDLSFGFTTVGDGQSGVGVAGDNNVVSLGDGGVAILTFTNPIINGVGADFAVFENSFNDTFLELAFVEVSSNGIDYVRFPCHSQTQTTTQVGGFDNLNPTNIHNLAGKYRARFGTPFDLEDLVDSANVDVNNITHVKIIDVIGVLNATETNYDSYGNQINDPFPTPYESSGFDLDGVGVVHQFVNINVLDDLEVTLYPNPSNGDFNLVFKDSCLKEILFFNSFGQLVENKKSTSQYVSFNSIPKGFYTLKLKIGTKYRLMKVIIN